MKKFYYNKGDNKGQYLAEYALIFSIVLAALITMQTYVKRGLQGRFKDATDEVIVSLREAKGNLNLPLQYEPYYTASKITTIANRIRIESESLSGEKETEIDNTTTRSGYQMVLPAEAE